MQMLKVYKRRCSEAAELHTCTRIQASVVKRSRCHPWGLGENQWPSPAPCWDRCHLDHLRSRSWSGRWKQGEKWQKLGFGSTILFTLWRGISLDRFCSFPSWPCLWLGVEKLPCLAYLYPTGSPMHLALRAPSAPHLSSPLQGSTRGNFLTLSAKTYHQAPHWKRFTLDSHSIHSLHSTWRKHNRCGPDAQRWGIINCALFSWNFILMSEKNQPAINTVIRSIRESNKITSQMGNNREGDEGWAVLSNAGE